LKGNANGNVLIGYRVFFISPSTVNIFSFVFYI
jgi:hypothetical protein